MHTYKIRLQKEAEGGFTVTVPALPGCITYGENLDEAISMAEEAIELYLDELKERSEIISHSPSFSTRGKWLIVFNYQTTNQYLPIPGLFHQHNRRSN